MLPLVYRKSQEFIEEAKKQGMEIRITSGYRSKEEQDRLYTLGRTVKSHVGVTAKKPLGDTVTNAKGGQSEHNFGIAFDVVFVKEGYNGNWTKLSKIGIKIGLDWGGLWVSRKDLPHWGLKLGYKLKDFQQNKVDYSKYQ